MLQLKHKSLGSVVVCLHTEEEKFLSRQESPGIMLWSMLFRCSVWMSTAVPSGLKIDEPIMCIETYKSVVLLDMLQTQPHLHFTKNLEGRFSRESESEIPTLSPLSLCDDDWCLHQISGTCQVAPHNFAFQGVADTGPTKWKWAWRKEETPNLLIKLACVLVQTAEFWSVVEAYFLGTSAVKGMKSLS